MPRSAQPKNNFNSQDIRQNYFTNNINQYKNSSPNNSAQTTNNIINETITSITEDDLSRPVIHTVGKFKLQFSHNKSISCILDTGSVCSVMNSKLASHLLNNNIARKVENFDKSNYNFRNANSTKIPIDTSIIARFELNNNITEYLFIVTPNLNVPVLLGYDFFKKIRCSVGIQQK